VAAHYGDPAREYRALRESVAAVELADYGRLRIWGADHRDFLQGMLTHDVKGLAAGQGRHALLLSDQGKVVADLVALAGAEDVSLLGVGGGVENAAAALARYIVADDVELEPIVDERIVGIFGPGAGAAVRAIAVGEVPSEAYAHATLAVGGVDLELVRVPTPGAGGYLCRLPATAAPAWWSRLLDGGTVVAAGHEAFETWRIESGVPRYGLDVTADTLALEAPLEDAIAYGKGCYLGQEVVERVSARGHVNRRLSGLLCDGPSVPAAGERLFAGDREVGWVTSAAWSWSRTQPVALGYVRREHLEPGTVLALGEAAGDRRATVAALPLA
jgi:folate-binding protein YgfZ